MKLLLRNSQAPGDIVMLTAAVRDLHHHHPGQFQTDVRTSCPALWENNPHLTPLDERDPAVRVIDCEYPLIHQSNQRPFHFLHGFTRHLGEQLQLTIEPTAFQGDIHLSEQEINGTVFGEESPQWREAFPFPLGTAKAEIAGFTGETPGDTAGTAAPLPLWLISAGGKQDFTIKWWATGRYQQVVDHFRGRIQFVQVGEAGHFHPSLRGVLDLRGKTSLRQLVRLMHHADGVLTPVSLLMHLSAAVPTRAEVQSSRFQVPSSKFDGQSCSSRPCVVIAGGREPAHWEAYPTHQFLHTIGMLPCCRHGGCWKSRTLPLNDGSENDAPRNLCVDVVGKLPHCMDMITAQDVIRRIELYLQTPNNPSETNGAVNGFTAQVPRTETLPVLGVGPSTFERVRREMDEFIESLSAVGRVTPCAPQGGMESPDGAHGVARPTVGDGACGATRPTLTGRGIVICGGGRKYFTCAWVCIQMLRRLGCQLPVQIWHLGPEEMDEKMVALVKPLGVECVDALEVRKKHPARTLNGWELKAYAILRSPFREVLLLDADNVPVVNPEFLFETPQFQKTGAIFWPDYGRLGPERAIWKICGVEYRDEPEFESGQIVVNKERCWREMNLTMWMNEHSDFFYQHIHGDKDTFHLAWRKLQREYSMPTRPIQPLRDTMCQHDFEGRRIFQHRNFAKWKLFGENPRITDFLFEKECLEFLEQLRAVWSRDFDLHAKTERERETALALLQTSFEYRRVGHDQRPMRFQPNGTIGQGAAGCEMFWDVRQQNGHVALEISSEQELTCRLVKNEQGVWSGRWEKHEKMPVELVPQKEAGQS